MNVVGFVVSFALADQFNVDVGEISQPTNKRMRFFPSVLTLFAYFMTFSSILNS